MPLLFDGAMGTWYASQGGSGPCERGNLTNPEKIRSIHRAYIEAGCRCIKTNTFAAGPSTLGEDWLSVVKAGWAIAKEAADPDTLVFADMGPASPDADQAAEFRRVADCFLSLGARYFLFETLPDLTGIPETVRHIKTVCPEAFVLVSFAAQPDGFTATGQSVRTLLRTENPDIDAVGLNCVCSAAHMGKLLERIGPLEKPVSVMPNAGYPTVLGRRTIYQGDPAFFGKQLRELAERGAQILGGCCGTTPDHIRAAAAALKEPLTPRITVTETKSPPPVSEDNPFWDVLQDPAKKAVAVELDPPEAADVSKFMDGARELQTGGADIITIADCPIARARMDASLLACKLQRELGMQALPHMTCRDRNLNATKALLLGLCAEGVRNVLTITGDPIPSARRDEVKSVYNFNSRMLAGYVRSLGEELPVPFRVFGALNVNAKNMQVQLHLAQQKVKSGVNGFLTQPVLTAQGMDALKQARDTLDPDVKILGGIIPIVSQRNALFMNSEVAGISVSQEIIDRYAGLDRAAAEDLAVEISLDMAGKMSPYVDGYYLITPFSRTGLVARILKAL